MIKASCRPVAATTTVNAVIALLFDKRAPRSTNYIILGELSVRRTHVTVSPAWLSKAHPVRQ